MKEIRTLSQLLDALSRGYKIQNINQSSKPLSRSALWHEKDERHFCVCIAGHTIAIDSLYEEVYVLCKDYICDLEPEFRISINDIDIERERGVANQKYGSYSNSYLETLVVYRKMSEALLFYNIILMHGAVIAIDQSSFLFMASSGTGKTTHIKKWLENAKGSYVVNGDKPLIKVTDSHIMACGTPWSGKESLNTNTMVPLKAIVLMYRSENNSIQEITYGQAFSFLLQQTYHPEEELLARKTLSLLTQLREKVRFYRYDFNNMKDDAFQVSYNTLVENQYE